MKKEKEELEEEFPVQTTFEDNNIEELNDGGEVQNVYTTKGVAEKGE